MRNFFYYQIREQDQTGKKIKHKTAIAESQETDLDLTWDIY